MVRDDMRKNHRGARLKRESILFLVIPHSEIVKVYGYRRKKTQYLPVQYNEKIYA